VRYEKGHKDATRKRIVKAAAKRFRKEGVGSVGVAGLMADAGLTHGGFYAHFGSKEELFREAVGNALDETLARLTRFAKGDPGGLEAMVRDYLDAWQIEKPERGCAAASLVAEIARSSRPTRIAFEKKLEGFVELIAQQLSESDRDVRRRRAVAIFGSLIGTLQLARAVADKRLSDQIRQSGIDAVMCLARHGKK
jgi:AcrR family transcriptional regulator